MISEADLLAMPADTYMNEVQQAFFRQRLLEQRAELQQRIDEEFGQLREQQPASDPADLGSAEEQRQWQLRLLEREKKLLDKIDEALERLARGEYGWCPGSAPRFVVAALLRQMAPGKARDAGNGGPLPSPATPHGAICRATRRAVPVFARCVVARRLIWSTKLRVSRLTPRKNGRWRGHYETGGRPSTGEPIGLRRLLLRPTASLCIEAKERQEQRERHIRDVRGNPNG